MAGETWTCSKCGQIYPMADTSCPVCFVTRDNLHVVGKIETTIRKPKPPPEKVEVGFPFFIKEARFNLPMPSGAVWSSGRLMATPAGIFLLTDRDNLDAEALAAAPPPPAGAIGPVSMFFPLGQIGRVVNTKLVGQFIELKPKQKIPLRLTPSGWTDLGVICDQLGIARE